MEFDLERYLRASRRLDLDGIDWDEARAHPLSDDEVRCLTCMMDIETHTIVYLRELLSTPAAEDPESDVPLGTVKSRIRLALRRLRAVLEPA